MKWPHLLRVREGSEAVRELIAAARERGQRIGWLELGAPGATVSPEAGSTAGELASMAGAGALRAVRVSPLEAGGAKVESCKVLAGAPVLRDLLREHFRGCQLVLLGGEGPEVESPHGEHPARLERLDAREAEGGPGEERPAWRLTQRGEAGEKQLDLTTDALLQRLHRPRLF